MTKFPTTTTLYLGIAIISTLLLRVRAEVTCYAPDGITIADNQTYVPCNKLGITQQGVHSSCCRLDGAPDDRDLCTSTGLCLNNGVVSRGYCTDKTWKSPACVNVCTNPSWGGSQTGVAEMTSCTDGTYCCGHNNLTCCGTQWAVKVPLLTGSTTTTITATATPQPASTIPIYAGLGGALGLVTLISSGLIFFLTRYIRKLRSELRNRDERESRLGMLGSDRGGLGSPQFGTTTLSPLPPNAGGLASASNSTTPWTAAGDMSQVEYGNFKGLYDPPFVQPQSQSQSQGGNNGPVVPMEMALSPPRSELDGGGGQFSGIGMRIRLPPAQQPVIMEAERSISVRSLEGRAGWGVGDGRVV